MEDDELLLGGESRNTRTEVPDDEMLDDGEVGFNLSRYSSEIVTVVVIAIIIAVARAMVPKRDRGGCTFFILVFFLILYLVNRYIHF